MVAVESPLPLNSRSFSIKMSSIYMKFNEIIDAYLHAIVDVLIDFLVTANSRSSQPNHSRTSLDAAKVPSLGGAVRGL